jgi:hypothetical protein
MYKLQAAVGDRRARRFPIGAQTASLPHNCLKPWNSAADFGDGSLARPEKGGGP